MELKFDSNLDYQQHAVNNAVRLFEGQPKEEYSEYLEYEQDIDLTMHEWNASPITLCCLKSR